MSRLRTSIYYISLISLLLAACVSAHAGVVALTVEVQPSGPGSQGNYVCKGCDIKFVYTASDCDTVESTCCWDDLSFTWPEGIPLPTKVNDTIYMGECIVTCNWTGAKDFVFSADDLEECTDEETDDAATQTITITTVAVGDIIVYNAPWLYDENAPACPCPDGQITFNATTIPGGYEHLIPWAGGEVYESNTGASFTTYWTTPGSKTVTAGCGEGAKTITVDVAAPYYETGFVDLTGPVGGTAAVKYQVKTRCAVGGAPNLQARHTTADTWYNLQMLGQGCGGVFADEDGVRTTTYPLNLWSTIEREIGLDGKQHNLDKVDEYMLRGEAEITPCTTGQALTDTRTAEIGVHNLTVESVSPEGVVFWTGEEGTTVPITVTIDDNNLSDPVTLTLELYYTGQNNIGGWSSSATLVAENVTTGSHTFNWNGTATGQPGGNLLESGTYTYKVIATQTDSGNCEDCQGNPLSPEAAIQAGCIAVDTETCRSEYLTIQRAVDGEGNPIYEVEYDGYDDNNTEEDESDDGYYYVIRKYGLYDTLGTDASEGVIWLYGPDGQRKYEWPINTLPCVDHENACDGLHVNLEHALRMRVQASLMNDEGTYRFVIHIKDAHGDLYRNGQDRWALDLNAANKMRVFHIEDDWMKKPDGTSLRAPARATRLKNAFAFGDWRVKTAPAEVDEDYCTEIPYQYSFDGNAGLMNTCSHEHFHYYSQRNSENLYGWRPFRYVHVVGAGYYAPYIGDGGDSDGVYGYSARCDYSIARWAFVFTDALRRHYHTHPEALADAQLITTIHEVGHAAFMLPDHEQSDPSARTERDSGNSLLGKMYCVMVQGDSNPDYWDYHFCKGCLRAIKAYGHGYCGGGWMP